MKTLIILILAAVSVYAQNTGGGSSGGGGGGPVTFTTPYPVTTATDTSANAVPLYVNSNRLLALGNPTAIAEGQASNVLKMTGLGTASYLPLNVFPSIFNGTTLDSQFYCNTTATGTVTASGATQILALVAAKSYRICAFRVSTTPAVAVALTQGTGSNCGTGTTNLSLSLLGVTNVVLEPGATAAYKAVAGNALCITLGAAQTVNYDISYTVF